MATGRTSMTESESGGPMVTALFAFVAAVMTRRSRPRLRLRRRNVLRGTMFRGWLPDAMTVGSSPSVSRRSHSRATFGCYQRRTCADLAALPAGQGGPVFTKGCEDQVRRDIFGWLPRSAG
ncbi:Uncharacterised protein [Mycobacteroides abscessus subsp. abscessus]|nr:Uncharacterised protein [Mycobacteroides abscessus subsp. abscessus]